MGLTTGKTVSSVACLLQRHFRLQDEFNMALPPEQINIKRRREEEPVETLCMKPLVCLEIYPTIKLSPSDSMSAHILLSSIKLLLFALHIRLQS